MCTRVHQNGALDRFGYPRIVMALVGQEFDVLRIEIIGNLGSDPEQRYTAEGKAQVSIRVAVNSRRRGADGEQVERTDWFRARAMARRPSTCRGSQRGSVCWSSDAWRSANGRRTRASRECRTPREDNKGLLERPAQTAGLGASARSGEIPYEVDELPF